jgi:hypothetical protein
MKKMIGFLCVGLLLLAIQTTAIAGPVDVPTFGIWIDDPNDSAAPLFIYDGDTNDSALSAGVITYVGVPLPGGGVWTVSVTTGQGYPALGSDSSLHVDLNSADTSSAAGDLLIGMSQTHYIDGNVPMLMPFSTDFGGTSNGTIAAAAWIDDLNWFDLDYVDPWSTEIASLGPFGPGAFSGSASGTALVGATGEGFYSITYEINISHGGAGVTSFDIETKTVPEPATLSLLGIGLLACGLFARKRK